MFIHTDTESGGRSDPKLGVLDLQFLTLSLIYIASNALHRYLFVFPPNPRLSKKLICTS